MNVRTLLSSAMLALAAGAPAFAQETIKTEKAQVVVDRVTDGLNHPWGLAFLPDRSMLVTEKPGRLRVVGEKGDVSEPIKGVPEVDARDQGGLLDVALDPDFAQNRLVYLSFSEKGEGGVNSTAVARGRLSEDHASLADVSVIFSQKPKVASTKHFGSRLVFDGKGRLFITLGERSEERFRSQSQDLKSHLGKIVRINPDGSVPKENPFVGRDDALPEIWSYGHRNIQAATLGPSGELMEIEHGPKGGDELNLPKPGGNYGWPVVSFGVNYDGTPVGSGKKHAEGMVDPIYQWTPVIAPSGMTFYTGNLIPEWNGDLFVGGLKVQSLVRLELEGGKVVHEERMLQELGMRIRDVVQGPDGALYLLTDEANGAILRVRTID